MTPETASRQFRTLLEGRVRFGAAGEPGPADLVGLEHEFVVRDGERVVDFRTLVRDLPVEGRRIDPGDVNAIRGPWGGNITADGAEAEIATAPVVRRPGFVGRLERHATHAAGILATALPAGVILSGYSTHLSAAMPRDLVVPAAELFLGTFAPGLMLLTDRRSSPGLLVRPRSGRLEAGTEFVSRDPLRAAIAYVSGAALAIGRHLRDGAPLPPKLVVDPVHTADRVGWGLRRTAFGEDLLRAGRSASLATLDGGRVTAQVHLEASWAIARAELDGSASAADLSAADSLVRGDQALPSELDTELPVDLAHEVTGEGPFGAVLRARRRGDMTISAQIATWDLTILRVDAPSRTTWAAVPRAQLSAFLSSLERGDLDAVLAAYLAAPTAGRRLAGWAAGQVPGLYDTLAEASAFIAPEAGYAVSPAALAAGARAGKAPEEPARPVEPEHPRTTTRPERGGGFTRLTVIGLVIIALLTVGLLVSGVFNGGTPVPTGPASSPAESGGAIASPPGPTASAPGPVATAECRTAALLQTFMQAATVAVLHELCSRQMPDGRGDGVEYNGEPATVKPTVGDIATIVDPLITLSDADAARFAAACRRQPPFNPAATLAPPLPAGPVERGVYCGDADPAAGDYELFAMEMATPIALDPTANLWEAGVGFAKAGDKRWPSAIADPLNGHSWFLTVRFSANGGVYGPLAGSWSGTQGTFFEGSVTGAFALIDGEVMLILVPQAEWTGNEACRWFTYYGKADNSGGSVDLWPDPDEPEVDCNGS